MTFFRTVSLDRFKTNVLASATRLEGEEKSKDEEMVFSLTEHARFGIRPPVSVEISRTHSGIRMYTFTPVSFRSTGKFEFNIPMDPESFIRTQFRLFFHTSGTWSAAPGKDPEGKAYYRVYSAYAAGWARIFVLPSVQDSYSEWAVSVRILTMTVESTPEDLDCRNYRQVCSLFRSKKM
ncbi:MAG: hypothetical protein JJU34_11895 [Lunatimonas sp.]|uniref:hypothetical protein n=1 Tax=Lunatimonas sp. TaxID=2060141 RepID=UPI00263B1934|nr:hypothetical protein [Lunatimonas sp.]MCC5937973.1 hypothetical protein [Lunatimonas sp.]